MEVSGERASERATWILELFFFLELLLWDCMTWFTFFLSNQQNDHGADKEKDDDVRQGFKGEDEKFLLAPPSRAETEPCVGG